MAKQGGQGPCKNIIKMKHYIKQGENYIELPEEQNKVGWYYNRNGKLTPKRTVASIGVCVNQTQSEYTICSILRSNKIPSVQAKAWCESQFGGKGYLPTRSELITVVDHPDLFGMLFKYPLFEPSEFWAHAGSTMWRISTAYNKSVYSDATFALANCIAFLKIPREEELG